MISWPITPASMAGMVATSEPRARSLLSADDGVRRRRSDTGAPRDSNPVTGARPRHSRTRHVPWLLLAAALFGAGCNSGPTIITADAQPIVDRIIAADPLERWTFVYQPDSASPYLACLVGIDEVQGSVDVSSSVLWLKPNREAPPVIVTDTSVLVPDAGAPQTWHEIAWTPDLDLEVLRPIFGEVLAGEIATGLGAPDLNMTTRALIDIASSVETTDPPFQLAGDAIRIAVDRDRYREELEADDAGLSDDERDAVPTFTAVVDPLGRVSALVVDSDSIQPDQGEGGHGNRYIVTATFDDLDPIATPPAEDRKPATLADISYPTPDASCGFGR